MEDIRKYAFDMGYSVDNMAQFVESFEKTCTSHTWREVFKYLFIRVRPKQEVEIIRKVCFSSLQSQIPDTSGSYRPKMESLKDVNEFLERCKLTKELTDQLDQYGKLKESLENQLTEIQLSNIQKVERQDNDKEAILKLFLLTKKKKQVQLDIKELNKMAKKLKLMASQAESLVSYGSDRTDRERSLERSTKGRSPDVVIRGLILDLSKFLENDSPQVLSQLNSDLLYSMEKQLFEKLELLTKIKEEELNCRLVAIKEEVKQAIQKRNPELSADIVEELTLCIRHPALSDLHPKQLQIPLTVQLEREKVRRLAQLVERKFAELRSRLRCSEQLAEIVHSELARIQAALPQPLSSSVHLLNNSVRREVDLFLAKPLLPHRRKSSSGSMELYSEFPSSQTMESFLQRLYKDIQLLNDFKKLEEKLDNHQLPQIDKKKIHTYLQQTVLEMKQSISDKIGEANRKLTDAKVANEKLASAFQFWRQEPLNEALTGLEVEGKDIQHWLSRHREVMARLKHEQRISFLLSNPSS